MPEGHSPASAPPTRTIWTSVLFVVLAFFVGLTAVNFFHDPHKVSVLSYAVAGITWLCGFALFLLRESQGRKRVKAALEVFIVITTGLTLALQRKSDSLAEPRSISVETAATIRAKLLPFANSDPLPSITIICPPRSNDGTSLQFAHELARVIESAGWEHVDVQDNYRQTNREADVVGFWFLAYGLPEGGKPDARDQAVIDALSLIEGPCSVYPGSGKSTARVGDIEVGKRSLARAPGPCVIKPSNADREWTPTATPVTPPPSP